MKEHPHLYVFKGTMTHTIQRSVSICIAALLLVAFFVPTPAFADLILSQQEKRGTLNTDEQWLLSYYAGYQYHYFKPKDIDFTLLTHIAVGGVGVYPDGSLREHWHREGDAAQQKEDGRDMAKEVAGYARREGVTTLLWLGGPNEEEKLYAAASNSVSRAKMVQELLALIDAVGFDGIDINWEPIRLQDREPLLLLVQDLRAAREDIVLTVPINWIATNGTEARDVVWYAALAKYVDKLPVMSYSMAGPWAGWEVWHGAALYGNNPNKTPSSVASTIATYRDAGVPAEKLLLGIGAYGTCWEYPVNRPREDVPLGYGSNKIGVLALRTVDSQYYRRSSEEWDKEANVPYLSFRSAKGDYECGFISYENKRSVRAKATYARDEDLGGVIFWNIGTGYYPDERGTKKHPLLREVAQVLGV